MPNKNPSSHASSKKAETAAASEAWQPSPSKSTGKHHVSPETGSPRDERKDQEIERGGIKVRQSHAAVRTRRKGG